mmetsp:Transcript_9264/g.19249  ORF Transcript_9264/g.19249 Transcript_9264/m.19249 type:complete len:94 (-) Transcript_9264:43-324(-)
MTTKIHPSFKNILGKPGNFQGLENHEERFDGSNDSFAVPSLEQIVEASQLCIQLIKRVFDLGERYACVSVNGAVVVVWKILVGWMPRMFRCRF